MSQQPTKAKWARTPVTDPAFLAEYELEESWAPSVGLHPRTSQNYRNQPNGLPFVRWGGRIWIHKAGGAEFIRSRINRRAIAQRVAKRC
jgi:hypothetical protein